MDTHKKLSKVFDTSKEISFNDDSKIIIMSDCHRGNGSFNDNFAKNKNIYLAALRYYYKKGFTYIEIGDGDELWENEHLESIIASHNDVFSLLSKFYQRKRLYMLYGNHDIQKIDDYIKTSVLKEYYNKYTKKNMPLFADINIEEGLILNYEKTGDKIFLTHGHQGDFLNDTIWKIARLLAKYLWGPLELIGIRNPTSVAINDRCKNKVEKKLIAWTKNNNQMLIAGHTHRTVFPKPGKHLYFNDGCCTYACHITGIEITNSCISLIKWSVKTKEDRTLFIDREIIDGPIKLRDYFNSTNFIK